MRNDLILTLKSSNQHKLKSQIEDESGKFKRINLDYSEGDSLLFGIQKKEKTKREKRLKEENWGSMFIRDNIPVILFSLFLLSFFLLLFRSKAFDLSLGINLIFELNEKKQKIAFFGEILSSQNILIKVNLCLKKVSFNWTSD
jgi:hypothetical protein